MKKSDGGRTCCATSAQCDSQRTRSEKRRAWRRSSSSAEWVMLMPRNRFAYGHRMEFINPKSTTSLWHSPCCASCMRNTRIVVGIKTFILLVLAGLVLRAETALSIETTNASSGSGMLLAVNITDSEVKKSSISELPAGSGSELPFGDINPIPETLQDLKEITFKSLNPVPIYQKTYFSWIVIGATILASCLFTYFTAGAGAPAAYTGVSTVASWIAGGGAGSYMGGLATVGACIGGNAMTGAAILNGLSMALGGTAVKTIGSAIISAAFFTATMLDGVAPLMKPGAGRLHYTVRINPPANMGSTYVRKLVEEMQAVRERQAKILKTMNMDGSQKQDLKPLESVSSEFTRLMIDARNLLEKGLKSNNITSSDLLVLGIVNYGSGEENSVELFQNAISRLAKGQRNLKRSGYLKYLMAISCLCDGNEKTAMRLLDESIADEPYAIEPAVLKLNLLANNFFETEPRAKNTVDFLSKNFSPNQYKTDMTLVAPYFRMATIYYSNGKFKESKDYYSKALGEIGFIEGVIGDPSLQREIQLGIINSLFRMGETQKAGKIYSEAVKKMNFSEEKKFRERYAGADAM
jgi:hypothetical protein